MANPLVALLIRHGLAGAAAGCVTLGGLLWLDVGGLLTLIRADADGAVAAVLLTSGFVLTFASVAMGAAIIGLGRPGGSGATPSTEPVAMGPLAAGRVFRPSTAPRTFSGPG